MNSNLQGAAIPVPDGAVEAGLHGSSGDTGMCGKPCTFEGFECKTDMFKGNTCTKCMPSGTGTVKDPKWTCVDPNGPTPAPTPPPSMCGQPSTFMGFKCKTDMKKGNTCTKCMPSGTGTVKDPKWTCVDPNSIDESYASGEESTPMNYLRAN